MGFLLVAIVASIVVFGAVFVVSTVLIQCHPYSSELSRFRNYSERSYSENMQAPQEFP